MALNDVQRWKAVHPGPKPDSHGWQLVCVGHFWMSLELTWPRAWVRLYQVHVEPSAHTWCATTTRSPFSLLCRSRVHTSVSPNAAIFSDYRSCCSSTSVSAMWWWEMRHKSAANLLKVNCDLCQVRAWQRSYFICTWTERNRDRERQMEKQMKRRMMIIMVKEITYVPLSAVVWYQFIYIMSCFHAAWHHLVLAFCFDWLLGEWTSADVKITIPVLKIASSTHLTHCTHTVCDLAVMMVWAACHW